MQAVAELLEVEPGPLLGAMTSYKVREMRQTLTVSKAEKNRDAFTKAVFAQLFDWLVERINHAASGGGKGGSTGGGSALQGTKDPLKGTKFIGVLDIFGFEIFETNSIEQLLINYANEKLQANFTKTTFENEEGMYLAEGIQFDHIEYADNAPVLQLIEGKGGIVPMVDEESKLPNTSDKTLLEKLNASFAQGKHPRYATSLKRGSEDCFSVKHYAGDVLYAVTGFLEKSVDNISAELIAALKSSSAPVVAALFSLGSARDTNTSSAGASSSAFGAGKSRKPTVGAIFTRELKALVELLESTSSHFIRCIKPNATKSATAVDRRMVLEHS